MFRGLDRQEAWRLFYDVACMCHPSQGGCDADMRGLCALAREALDDWPDAWTVSTPALFDVFCKATGTPPPPQLDMTAFRLDLDADADAPTGFVSGASWAPASRVSRVFLVDRLP